MKGILGLLRHKTQPEPGADKLDSLLFTTAFAGQGVDASLLVPWEARAVEVGAKRLNPAVGIKLLQDLWTKDRYTSHLESAAIQRMGRFFDFATVPASRDIIRQDEYGNFMVVLLKGNYGRPGAGISPIRGHSNVQGDRTVGIDEKPTQAYLDQVQRVSRSCVTAGARSISAVGRRSTRGSGRLMAPVQPEVLAIAAWRSARRLSPSAPSTTATASGPSRP